MSGTQISDMVDSLTVFPDGAFIPLVVTTNVAGLVTTQNYRYNAGLYLAKLSTLAGVTGATLIGSTGPSTVQADLNARPTSATLAASGGSELIGTILPSVGAEERTQAAKNADSVNVMDFQANPASLDITTALETAMYTAFPDAEGLEIKIPEGLGWVCTRQLIPARQIFLRGAGMSITQITFTNVATLNATMKGALCFGLATTLIAYDPAYASKAHGNSSTVNGGSDYSQVSDLTIAIAGTRPANFDYGIWTAGRLQCRDVIAQACGFKWTAGALQSTAGTIIGNANVCLFDNCQSFLATDHGFFADGDDANACKIIGCNAYEPNGYGFQDYSLLGNDYEGCHASTVLNNEPAYRALSPNQANASVFSACYAEDNGEVNLWEVEAPARIVNPLGTAPVPSAGFNLTDSALFGTSNLVWESYIHRLAPTRALATTLGDASNPALELAQNMIRWRAADNIIYSLAGGGGGLTFLSGATTVATITAGQLEVVGRVRTIPVAVSALPAAAAGLAGSRAAVNDSNAALTAGIGAVVAGGGANTVPVFCDGAAWRIG